MNCLGRIPPILVDIRNLTTLKDNMFTRDLYQRTRAVYNTSLEILAETRRQCLELSATLANSGQCSYRPSREWMLYAQSQRIYGLALFSPCAISPLLRPLCTREERSSLWREAEGFVDEVMFLADAAEPFRPMGSAVVILCFIVAMRCTTNAATKLVIRRRYDDFSSDFTALCHDGLKYDVCEGTVMQDFV